jgi:hypothetical protein
MPSNLTKVWALAAAAALAAAPAARAEPLAPHPAGGALSASDWTAQMGQFGETLVRESHRARGEEVFDLNVGSHGIDGLVRTCGADGRPSYKIIEIKTVQDGTDFRLGMTEDGRQLSAAWVEKRLAKAAKDHPEGKVRKAAAKALKQFQRDPASVPLELHGLSVGQDRYVVKPVDPVTGAFKQEVANSRMTEVLEDLSKNASSKEVRQAASQSLAEYPKLRAGARPRVVAGGALARELGEAAGVEEKRLASTLKEASEHIRAPGQSRWVKAGGKAFKFVGKAAGPAGVVIAVAAYTSEAADIEQRLESGELTREQADAAQARLAVGQAAGWGGAAAGGTAGAVIGSFLCPGPGTVIGGVVGAVGGCVGAELMMAATGLAETLGEYLTPGAEAVRQDCTFLKAKGVEVTVAGREQVRERVGPEAYDEIAAGLESAVTWAGGKAKQAGEAVRDAAVYAKDKTVEGACYLGDAVSAGASWTWDRAKSGWSYLGLR